MGATEARASFIDFSSEITRRKPHWGQGKNRSCGVAARAVVGDCGALLQLREVRRVSIVSAYVTVGGVETQSPIEGSAADKEEASCLSLPPLKKSAGSGRGNGHRNLSADGLPSVAASGISLVAKIDIRKRGGLGDTGGAGTIRRGLQ